MKIFLACPVRNITNEYREKIEAQVKSLESRGFEVYYPARDTMQDVAPYLICSQNRRAIEAADKVFVIWDGKSTGVLFDMGVAFALDKEIRTITGYMPPMSREKSFQNLFYEWEEIDKPQFNSTTEFELAAAEGHIS